MDVVIGDVVKAVDTNGDIVDSEVVSILHKNHNDTSIISSIQKFRIIYFLYKIIKKKLCFKACTIQMTITFH